MTSLLNILTGSTNNDVYKFKKTKEGFTKNAGTVSLTQGERFMQYQNKIAKRTKNAKEGFTPLLSKETHLILDSTDPLALPVYKNAMKQLNDQTNKTLRQYESAETGGNNELNNYYARISPKNPYLNKNIRFTTGEVCYVTNQGVVKLYPNTSLYLATAGQNGCPSDNAVTQLNIKWLSSYNSPNVAIDSPVPLITGTPMTQGQSCGHEGTNVYVNKMVNSNTSSQYEGCYADNSTTPAMTFIGGNPPEQTAQIQNPAFDYPQLSPNTYQYINNFGDECQASLFTSEMVGTETIPGWMSCGGCIINNSTAWGYAMPYPNGDQAMCIQGSFYVYQNIYLNTGTYNLTFYATGRPAYSGTNTISIQFNMENGADAYINSFAPPNTEWQFYTFPITVTQSGNFVLGFQGVGSGVGGGGGSYTGGGGGVYSTAIQQVILDSATSSTSSAGGGGSYTEEICKQAAMYQGYKYYAVQDANTSGVGYCAVSNDLIQSTQYGKGVTISKMPVSWQSGTTGQPGNTATLNEMGTLSVINSSGTVVFSTPNSSTFPNNYYGCYGDAANRAVNGGAMLNGSIEPANQSNGSNYTWGYDSQTCQQAAQDGGFSLFGLQDSNTEGQAVCFLGNSLPDALSYGTATNCTQFADGSVQGGGYSNAVYSVGGTSPNYFLSITDQGLLSICLGQNPTDNQGVIWSYQTTAALVASPLYAAANSPSGQNWMAVGTSLASGDFVGSPNGYCALIMQSSGNLEFVTFQVGSSCAKINGTTVGGVNANAIYGLSETGILDNMGLVAYIDPDSILHPYQTTNTALGNSYTKMPFFDSSGNNLPNAPFAVSSSGQCENICNDNNECYGFSIINGMCYPKNNQMYPVGQIQQNPSAELYLRSTFPDVPPSGAPLGINDVNSDLYANYQVSDEYVSNSGAPINGSAPDFNLINPATSPVMQQLQGQLNKYGGKTNAALNMYNKSDIKVNDQSSKNVKGLDNYLKDLKTTRKKIKQFNLTTSNILDNSDIVVLQQNYDYMFWSILAIGAVVISMNIVKK